MTTTRMPQVGERWRLVGGKRLDGFECSACHKRMVRQARKSVRDRLIGSVVEVVPLGPTLCNACGALSTPSNGEVAVRLNEGFVVHGVKRTDFQVPASWLEPVE